MILIQIFKRNSVIANWEVVATIGDGFPTSSKTRSLGCVPLYPVGRQQKLDEVTEVRDDVLRGNWGCGTRRGCPSGGIPIPGRE